VAAQLLRRLFTVDEYHKVAEAGIPGEDDRVELLEGEVVKTAPLALRHATCVRRLNRLFSRSVGERAIVDVQNPIRLLTPSWARRPRKSDAEVVNWPERGRRREITCWT